MAYTYQWLADDTEITDATASAYTLTEAEEGKAIKVKVSFNDDEGTHSHIGADRHPLLYPGQLLPLLQTQRPPLRSNRPPQKRFPLQCR